MGSQLVGDHVNVLLREETEVVKRTDQIDQIARGIVRQTAMNLVAENRNHVLLEIALGQLHAARIAKEKAERGRSIEFSGPKANVVAHTSLQFGRNDPAFHVGAINEDQLERRHAMNERAEGIRHFGESRDRVPLKKQYMCSVCG